MNPYQFVLANFPQSGVIENAALMAVVQLMGEAYSSGFERGPGNSEVDYVLRQVETKFGPTHPVTTRLHSMLLQHAGR